MTRRNNDTLREEYLRWLEPQFRDEHGNPDKNYWGLINLMFETPFGWLLPRDENRVVDGLDLRVEFANQHRLRTDTLEFLGLCSFLEVLIGLSRRMAFVAGGQPPGWAWHLLTNLELDRLSDPFGPPKRNKAVEIMNTVIERTYSPDGTGGFFPLAWPEDDMTQIELWYQMNIYTSELHPEH